MATIILQPSSITTVSAAVSPSHFPSNPTSTSPPPPSPIPLPFFKHKHSRRRLYSSTAAGQLLLSPHFSSNISKSQTFFPLCPINASTSLKTSNAGLTVDVDEFFNLLRLSVRNADIGLARAVHASILKLEGDTHLGNSVISTYLKLGLVADAYGVFKGMPGPCVVSYSALISGFAKLNREGEAIELFFRMRREGVEPNEYSFVGVLSACVGVSEFELGSQIHALAIKLGYLECVFVANALMGLYGNCGRLGFVFQLFDEMPQRDTASLNTVLSSMVKGLSGEKALECFRDLNQSNGFEADQFTLLTLSSACTGCHAVLEGRAVHGRAIRIGSETNLSLNNAMIKFYTKCGSLNNVEALFARTTVMDIVTWTEMISAYMEFGLMDSAVEIFEKMPERNSVSCNALLAGFCRNGEGAKALDLFIKMVQLGVELSDFSLTSVVNACGLLMTLEISEQIHAFVIKFGFGSNACIETALLDMCIRCGRMKDAEKMFQRWPSDWDSSIIQTSMLCGYARNGLPYEAISLFHRSQYEGTMVVDEIALTSVISVCGTLGFHYMGKQIHCRALKTGFLADSGVGNSIISMYSKCYNMNDAIKTFNMIPDHDIVSWNSLIAGYLLHRQGDEALAVWSRMEKAGIKPDTITYVLIVSAYKHTSSNLVDDCRTLFFSMKTIYGLEPNSEHYASLVGVLGYWGLLEEAEEIIVKMPFEPEVSVWRALLDSCRLHLNTSVGKRVAKHILATEPQDPSTYVLVSNLYSASGRWHCSEMARENMKARGLRKHPCRSWIIHQEKVHSFYARDNSHPQTKDIYRGLEILIMECLKAGYEPDTSFVLHEVEEHQKKDFLFSHSAKLAATYGLLMARPGEAVRVVKNILLCGDCHTFLKCVSVVTRREIVVRDSSGFHCFSNGHCSCKDYW